VLPGAAINARSSYVAMIAPRIEQGGNVQVNGSAAYAAAEAVDITFSQGLFDIEVPVDGGTSDANGIVHTGTTGGPANAGATDNHTIYMVAVPKNQALTMLLAGSIGFAPAASGATVVNGQVILTSGFGYSGLGVSGGTEGAGSIDIGSSGDANFTSNVYAYADGSSRINASAGNVSFSGDVTLEDDPLTGVGNVALTADNGFKVSIGGDAHLVSGDQVAVSADHGASIGVGGTLGADGANSVSLFDDDHLGTIQADTLQVFTASVSNQASPDIVNLTVGFSGVATVGDLTAPGTLDISAEGNLTTGDLSAGTELIAYSSGNLAVGNATLTGSSGSASFDAQGTATFNGIVSAPNIYVTSADIDVVSGAWLGVQGVTKSLVLTAVTNLPVYLGNGMETQSGAYVLNEDGDIHAKRIVIQSVSASDGPSPDIYIGDVKIDGSQTSGGGTSSVIVDSYNGSIKLLGNVSYINAGPSDSLTLDSGKAVEVDTDTASYVMTGPSGNLAGSLIFDTPNAWITSGAILQQLEQNPNFDGRDTELATNSGTSNPLGFVGADGITVLPGGTFFVQNSGTADDMGGISVGDAGLLLENVEAAAGSVTIYGRQIKSDGTTVAGTDFAGTVRTFGTFASGSTVNGVPLGSAPPPPPPPPPPPLPALAAPGVGAAVVKSTPLLSVSVPLPRCADVPLSVPGASALPSWITAVP
jgi:hypothetical protein